MRSRPLALLLLLAASAPALAAPAPAAAWEGRVFDDRDGDGLPASTEPGLAGVVVSDGRTLALTDRDGRYRLQAHADAPVFVVKPTGWRLPLRADGLACVERVTIDQPA